MLINLLLYKPKWLVAPTMVMPASLRFHEDMPCNDPEAVDPALVEEMASTERALRTPISIPWKSRFTKGPAVHL